MRVAIVVPQKRPAAVHMQSQTKVLRPKLRRKYTPRWSGPIEGYTINILRRIYPRFAGQMEFEDLVQEAHIKFLVCARCYSKPSSRWGTVDNGAWFMALYKRSLDNQLKTLLQRQSRYSFLDYGRDEIIAELYVTKNNPSEDVAILELLASLPQELAGVLALLVKGVRAGVPTHLVSKLREVLQGQL